MRLYTTMILALLLSACATGSGTADPIPPYPPSLEQKPPTPPFVPREALAVAESVLDRAREWRPPGAVIIAVVADMNPSYGKTVYGPQVGLAARWIADELRPDLVLVAGDMVAGQKRGLDYDAMWRAFDRVFAIPLAEAGYPLYVTPGNHDGAAGPAFAIERSTYRRVWEDRQPDRKFVRGSNWPFYYGFDHSGVLFLGIDATTVGPLDPTQLDWLRETLRDNRSARAIVMFGHVPPLPFAIGREWEVLADPELESMLEEFGVDVVVTGHHHAYYPGRRGDVRYVGAAALGSGPRPLIGTRRDSPRAVTVITLLGDGSVYVEARIAPKFETIIDHKSLPERIDHAGRHLHREDVAVDSALKATQ